MAFFLARSSIWEMDIRKQFGQLIRAARLERDLTQEDLAFAASMNVTYLSDIERGVYNPTLAVVVNLSIALELHPSDLLAPLRISRIKPVKALVPATIDAKRKTKTPRKSE